MDTWIGLHHLEANGERSNTVYVLKSRGMSHSERQIVEMHAALEAEEAELERVARQGEGLEDGLTADRALMATRRGAAE